MKAKIIFFFSKFFNLFLEVVFPKFCLGCKKEGRYICKDCELFLLESSFVCSVCGNAGFFGKTHDKCFKKDCLNGLISGWEYNGLIKEAVHRIKYKGEYDIIKEIMEKFLKLIREDKVKRFDPFLKILVKKETVISYIPMFKKKERKRGFNQSKIIAKEFGKIFNKEVIPLLKKEKETIEQASIKKREIRLENQKNSFSFLKSACNQRLLKEKEIKNVILIDDVFTTGATMKECCKILKKRGIKKVWGFAIARTT